jgi:hypothetical protein
MNANEAWIWLIAILFVWFVLGAALCDLLSNVDAHADSESVPPPRQTLPDARGGMVATALRRTPGRQAPALPWRRCIRWPRARRRMSHVNRLHR